MSTANDNVVSIAIELLSLDADGSNDTRDCAAANDVVDIGGEVGEGWVNEVEVLTVLAFLDSSSREIRGN